MGPDTTVSGHTYVPFVILVKLMPIAMTFERPTPSTANAGSPKMDKVVPINDFLARIVFLHIPDRVQFRLLHGIEKNEFRKSVCVVLIMGVCF